MAVQQGALYLARERGWTAFVTMQNHLNLLYREEEREMLPLCKEEGIGVMPWSPLARGRLTRDWDETTERQETDDFGSGLYAASLDADRAVIEAVAAVAAERGVPRAQVALAWVAQKDDGDDADRRRIEARASDRCGRGAFAESVRRRRSRGSKRRMCRMRSPGFNSGWLKRRSITITLWCGKESLIVPDARMALSLPCAAFPRR